MTDADYVDDLAPFANNHLVVPSVRLCLTLSRELSLSFIAYGRSSGLHTVSPQSYCLLVLASHPTFARLCEGVHRSTSLMSTSLRFQQCPACLVRLILIVFVMGGWWLAAAALWGVASRTCSIFLAAFLCSCRQAFSLAVKLASM